MSDEALRALAREIEEWSHGGTPGLSKTFRRWHGVVEDAIRTIDALRAFQPASPCELHIRSATDSNPSITFPPHR